jgi:hypothetical protein
MPSAKYGNMPNITSANSSLVLDGCAEVLLAFLLQLWHFYAF